MLLIVKNGYLSHWGMYRTLCKSFLLIVSRLFVLHLWDMYPEHQLQLHRSTVLHLAPGSQGFAPHWNAMIDLEQALCTLVQTVKLSERAHALADSWASSKNYSIIHTQRSEYVVLSTTIVSVYSHVLSKIFQGDFWSFTYILPTLKVHASDKISVLCSVYGVRESHVLSGFFYHDLHLVIQSLNRR